MLYITGYCQDGPFADRTCQRTDFDSITDCMTAELDCINNTCLSFFNGVNHVCTFNTYSEMNVSSQPIECCFCDNTSHQWWDCDNTIPSSTTATPPATSQPSSNSEYINY